MALSGSSSTHFVPGAQCLAISAPGIWSVVPCPVSVHQHQPSVPPNIFTLSLVNTRVMAANIKPGGCGDWGGFIPQPDNILETGAGDLSLSELMRVNDTQP